MKQQTARLAFWLTIATFSATLAATRVSALREGEHLARPLQTIPYSMGEWAGTDDAPLPDRILKSLAASSYLSRTYRSGQQHVNLFIAFYRNQRAGESMHSPKYCMVGCGWEPLEHGIVDLRTGGQVFHVNRYRLYNAGDRILVLYWYQNRLRVLGSEYLSKALLAWDSLSYGYTSGSIVKITVPDTPESSQMAMNFAAWAIPQLRLCFDPSANTR